MFVTLAMIPSSHPDRAYNPAWRSTAATPGRTVASPMAASSNGTGTSSVGPPTYAYAPGYSKKVCPASRLRPAELTESTCGRPLGLRFHPKTGDLYIADAYKGLMRVGPGGGKATVLMNQAGRALLRFTNRVDVDQVTSEAFFTDSSMNYSRSQHERVTATGDSTGRIMKYDPKTSSVTVLSPVSRTSTASP
jgi:hypothetical protein